MLAGFAVAILAGLGAEALLTAARPRAFARGVDRPALVAAAGIVRLMLVLLWAQGRPNADDFQNFASQYVLLVLYLAGATLVLSWPGRAGPVTLRAAALVVRLADRLAGSYPVTDISRNPDLRSPREREWVEAISRTTEPLRLSRANHIHPRTIYQYGWGVVDGESTFAPSGLSRSLRGQPRGSASRICSTCGTCSPPALRRRRPRRRPARFERGPEPCTISRCPPRGRPVRSRSTRISFTGSRSLRARSSPRCASWRRMARSPPSRCGPGSRPPSGPSTASARARATGRQG